MHLAHAQFLFLARPVPPTRLGPSVLGPRAGCCPTTFNTTTPIGLRPASSSSKEKAAKAGKPDPERVARAKRHELSRIHHGRLAAPAPIPIRSANAEKARLIEGDPSNTRGFRLWAVWGFAVITSLVSLRWIQYQDAFLCRMAAIEDVKDRMGCGSMSDEEFQAFLQSGRPTVLQQMIWYEFEQRFSSRFRDGATDNVLEVVRSFREHWVCSLENLGQGRYHTLLLAVIAHGDLGHLLGALAFTPPMLSLAFRSCLFKPWSVVLLAAGSGVASNFVTVGEGWLALRASPPDPEDATTEKEIDQRIYRTGCLGASGMFYGVTAALTCLYPTARVFRFVPLWLFAPGLMGKDVWDGTWEGRRARVRKHIEAERAGVAPAGIRTNHTAHLAGAVFGVFFAVLKLSLGSRL